MRVLITGAHGQLGHELLRLVPDGFQVVGMSSTDLDITDSVKVTAVVEQLKPKLVINAAAYTAVDKSESEPERAWAINCNGIANLALVAERIGIPVFHISTDYVFSGNTQEPYREADKTIPASVYGASKLDGEKQLLTHCSRHLILRTSWVFGAHGNNFVKTMLRLGQEREQLGVVADQYGCPTSAASIANALWILANQYRDQGALQWGIYHFSGVPVCTWYDFALKIFQQAHELKVLPRVPEVHAITTVDYPTPAKRPTYSVLDCSKLKQLYGIESSDWRGELGNVLQQLMD